MNFNSLRDEELLLFKNEYMNDVFEELQKRYYYILNIKARKYYAAGLELEDFMQECNLALYDAIKC